ncbi:hypothetical protein HOV35_gp05 [Escherichia phage Sortsne]|uniref:Uncharacterized protein n=1 Tax=Escherichia phage Sortsne TaxID=2562456 RepID=A0A4D6DZ27_9CAUD|nr:hypothetical protein HOV35_gp05 [Escherichia phage Sortsne]QBZ71570.1 hypothetical protein [Escherichia phage Sortsne]
MDNATCFDFAACGELVHVVLDFRLLACEFRRFPVQVTLNSGVARCGFKVVIPLATAFLTVCDAYC